MSRINKSTRQETRDCIFKQTVEPAGRRNSPTQLCSACHYGASHAWSQVFAGVFLFRGRVYTRHSLYNCDFPFRSLHAPLLAALPAQPPALCRAALAYKQRHHRSAYSDWYWCSWSWENTITKYVYIKHYSIITRVDYESSRQGRTARDWR